MRNQDPSKMSSRLTRVLSMRRIRLQTNWARALMKMLPHPQFTQQTHPLRRIPYSTGRAQTFRSRTRALRSCFADSACGWKLCRLGISPQARKPCGFPILLWQTHSNYPSNHSSLPIRLLISSHPRINNQNIFMSSGRFFLEPIRSLFPSDSTEYDDARTINRP
jgi:hypothetical protein